MGFVELVEFIGGVCGFERGIVLEVFCEVDCEVALGESLE